MNPLLLKITDVHRFYQRIIPHVQKLQLDCGPKKLLDLCSEHYEGNVGIYIL
jgi:hypothetical protein